MLALDNKWVKQILALQQEDGSWGHFHTLSQPTKQQPITTEQTLRRLRILGFTKDDETIARTLAYMDHNLLRPHPTVFHEKKHDSKTYGDLMLAAWIRLFDPDNNAALSVAKKWAKVITCAFQSGKYSHAEYIVAYESEFTKLNPKAGITDIIDLLALKEKLLLQVKHSITPNTTEWESGYICKPSQFFNDRESFFYADNKDIADYECEYIVKSQLDDGSWAIPWGWNGYPEEWAISKYWWKGNGAILNILYLKGMGRLTL